MTPESDPFFRMSMVEDVKGWGGSSYVVGKSSTVLARWFQKE